MDPSGLIAIVVGLGFILGGNAMEGGHFSSLVQPTALMIVLGGTVGATWLASPNAELKLAFKLCKRIVFPGHSDRQKLLDDMVKVSTVARREGMLAVENLLNEIPDPFLVRGLRMLVDGASADDVKRVLEPEMDLEEHHGTQAGKVFETAGGFCPTIGILGAVLGLIHVMSNLADPSALGAGIAVAFVATIYGVGFANLLFIPMGSRIKKIVAHDAETRQMVLLGLVGIAAGVNARQVEEMLSAFTHGNGHAKKEAA
ncbi:MAG: flagellar motor protein [Deltaproteobacteria bacterium]|nr:flagellar motor protein [Deltaproteobacteria bacterium]